MYCSHQYLSIDQKKKFATPTLTPTNRLNLWRYKYKQFEVKWIDLVNTYRLIQKKFATPTLTPITLKSVYRR